MIIMTALHFPMKIYNFAAAAAAATTTMEFNTIPSITEKPIYLQAALARLLYKHVGGTLH
jgi:hypothetical protein